MNVLVLCDDYWHPAMIPMRGLAPLGESGFAFDFIGHTSEWSAGLMDEYPVVLLTKGNDISATNRTDWATDDVQQAFVDYVKRGSGLLVVHSGTAGYQDATQLRALIGGVFTHHPKQCPVTHRPQEGHPLTAGSSEFTLQDEHYFLAQDDPDADVFMTTESEHGTQPGGWTRTEGGGRVCMLSPGHNLDVWLHESYQALLKNGLLWCGAEDKSS